MTRRQRLDLLVLIVAAALCSCQRAAESPQDAARLLLVAASERGGGEGALVAAGAVGANGLDGADESSEPRDEGAAALVEPSVRDPFLPWGLPPPVAVTATPTRRAPVSREAPVDPAGRVGPFAGLLERGGRLYALFGGQFMPAGSTVGGWTIMEIGEKTCVVEQNGVTKRLLPGDTP